MARNPIFKLTKGALVVGLMLAGAGGARAATPTSDARDAWTWESSAGGGWTKAGAFGDRMPFTLEVRYECYRGTESEWDWLHPWVQQVTVSLGAQFRAGIHD